MRRCIPRKSFSHGANCCATIAIAEYELGERTTGFSPSSVSASAGIESCGESAARCHARIRSSVHRSVQRSRSPRAELRRLHRGWQSRRSGRRRSPRAPEGSDETMRDAAARRVYDVISDGVGLTRAFPRRRSKRCQENCTPTRWKLHARQFRRRTTSGGRVHHECECSSGGQCGNRRCGITGAGTLYKNCGSPTAAIPTTRGASCLATAPVITCKRIE